jgi:hypothetical protein
MFIVGKRGRKEVNFEGGGDRESLYELGAAARGGGGGGGGNGNGGPDPDERGGQCGSWLEDGNGNPIRRLGGAGAAYTHGHIEARERGCYEVREFPIGFYETVEAAQTDQIESKPQVMYRGERLAVPSSIVGDFDIADIKVGKDSQLAADGNLPGECFSNLSVGVRMVLDTAEPGILIVISAVNTDQNNEHDFKACLFGTVIE